MFVTDDSLLSRWFIGGCHIQYPTFLSKMDRSTYTTLISYLHIFPDICTCCRFAAYELEDGPHPKLSAFLDGARRRVAHQDFACLFRHDETCYLIRSNARIQGFTCAKCELSKGKPRTRLSAKGSHACTSEVDLPHFAVRFHENIVTI